MTFSCRLQAMDNHWMSGYPFIFNECVQSSQGRNHYNMLVLHNETMMDTFSLLLHFNLLNTFQTNMVKQRIMYCYGINQVFKEKNIDNHAMHITISP